ncbi:MAG: response regulator [Bryobacteraceae bacterium]|nr:response regulator [Bryobacteraceae bacterium]
MQDFALLGRRLEREKKARHSAEAIVEQKSRELYEANLKLQQANRELERQAEVMMQARDAALEVARIKTQFVANMSHEIRTPVHGVIGMTALLLGTNLTPEQIDFTEAIRSSAEALRGIMDDVLDLSKIEAGSMTLRPVDFELASVVTAALGVIGEAACNKGLDVSVSLDERLPRRLRGDAGRLRQVLINLIGNAAKFTERGEVAIDIAQDRDCDGHLWIRFQVRDTGIGIPLEAHSYLFQPFRQADGSSTRRHGGAGLGLTMCKMFVELMGGQIGFESVPERGSTFWFTVQVEKSNAPPQLAPSGTSAARRSERLLLVEDNLVNQKIAMRLLERLGYRVDLAMNGLEAVEAVQRVPYDLILMDCQMPEMDGYQAAAEIRRLESTKGGRVPILALTANAMPGDRERCLESGMDEHLAKPLNVSALDTALREWLSRPYSSGSAGW